MAASIVKSAAATNASAATSRTATLSGSTTTGNAIVVMAMNGFTGSGDTWTSGSVCTDNAGSTYTLVDHVVSGSPAQFSVATFVATNITGTASHAVTVSNNSGFFDIVAYEVTGVATSGIVGNHQTNTAASSTASTGSSMATTNGSVVLCCQCNNQGATNTPVDGTWTEDDGSTVLPGSSMHKSATGANVSQTWTLSVSASYFTAIIEILAGSGGGGGGTAWHDRAFPRGAQRGVAR